MTSSLVAVALAAATLSGLEKVPPAGGISSMRADIARMEQAAAARPTDAQLWNRLAMAQRRLARWTGDHTADDAAWTALKKALAADPENQESLALKGWIEAGRHDFEGAVQSARLAIQQQPESAWNYGVLADALTELGRYKEAVRAVDEMMKRRPSVGAYSRAAHLRALHGDREGAIDLMKLALEASSPADPEGLAWCLVMLGREFQALGRWKEAKGNYERSLLIVPGYHLALFHLAETLAASGELDRALQTTNALRATAPSVAASALAGELLVALGRHAEASQAFTEVDRVAALKDPSKAEPRWLARFYADRSRNLEDAIALTREELNTHQDIETWDGLAWALFKAGKVPEAREASARAISLGTVSARLYLHHGLIEIAAGNRTEGVGHLRRALSLGDLWPSERGAAQNVLKIVPGSR